jgi:hypothetical protein
MSDGLRIPMSKELVWANVMRPRIPLVYLDLFSVVYIARTLRGDDGVPPGYGELYEAALRAKGEQRAMFPLGEAHLWEINKITDPKQRARLADLLESLSDYQYLLGRTTIAELEFEAGIAKILGEDISARSLALVRPTLGQAFGFVGGMKVVDAQGRDSSEAVRTTMNDAEYEAMIAKMNYLMERAMLRGPSDEDLENLGKNPSFQPERAIEGQLSRVGWELETKRVLDEDPGWRRGRLRDLVGARELVHEWLDMLTRLRLDRVHRGEPAFEPNDAEMAALIGAMPHSQVAISWKTKFHQNPNHAWRPNHIADIDAVAVAYPYCEAVFPDKEVRSALLNSKELRAIGTFVPRRPLELAEWLDALPAVMAPDMFVPHPPNRVA